MSPKPHPEGMHRSRLDDNQPCGRYAIWDGEQVVGETERVALSLGRYWRAYPAGGDPAPRDFPFGRHNDQAMPWLRDPQADLET